MPKDPGSTPGSSTEPPHLFRQVRGCFFWGAATMKNPPSLAGRGMWSGIRLMAGECRYRADRIQMTRAMIARIPTMVQMSEPPRMMFSFRYLLINCVSPILEKNLFLRHPTFDYFPVNRCFMPLMSSGFAIASKTKTISWNWARSADWRV